MNLLILRLSLQRIALALGSLLVVSMLVFAITGVLPGDAAQAQLGQEATPETLHALREQMGLNVPAPVRYWRWLSGLLSGNPGDSIVTHTPVADMLASRLPNSLLLAAITAAVAVPLALVLGILAAMYRGSVFDRVVSSGAVAVVSVPEFLVATLAVLVFAVELHWLPALSYSVSLDSPMKMLRSFAMPVMTLCCVMVAQMMRMTRAAVIDQLKAPYIEMVLLKGATPMRMVLAHALPNAIGPIAVWLPLMTPSSMRSRFCCRNSWSNVGGTATNACVANTTKPSRSFGRLSTNFLRTSLAITKRVACLPLRTNPSSSDAMLPERSNATTMSTPLALICASLWTNRGCAIATIKSISASQRSFGRMLPAFDFVIPTMPLTNCTEE